MAKKCKTPKYGQSMIICYGMIPEDVITLVSDHTDEQKEIYDNQVLQTIERVIGYEDENLLKDKDFMDEVKENLADEEAFNLLGDWEIYFDNDTVIID